MKYVVYIRVSTDEQEQSGLGSKAQKKACLDWIKTQPKAPVEIWLETETGTDKKKKGKLIDKACMGDETQLHKSVLLKAISTLEPGDVFVVMSRCRLARDIYLMAMIERLIKREKATLYAVRSGNDNTPESQLMRMMIDVFATYEAMIISVRTKSALAAKKAQGERTGYIPYGKTLGMGNKLVFDPYEVRVIIRMRELRQEKMPFRKIAEVLNAEGYTNRAGNPWHYSAICRTYMNEIP